MSTPEFVPRPEGPDPGPYGGYGGALQHYRPGPGARPLPPPSSTTAPVFGPPPAAASPPWQPQPSDSLQRPATVGTASTLAVTGSLLFGCGLALLWLIAYSITSSFDPAEPDETVIFHLAERFQLGLRSGLAVALLGFPVAAIVAGFLVVLQRSWTRVVFTATGVLALAWSAWWLRQSLGWWVPAAVYVGVAVGIVWTSAATRWYAAGDARAARAGQEPPVSTTVRRPGDRPVR